MAISSDFFALVIGATNGWGGGTGEEASIDKQVACEECPMWLKMTEVACEKTEVAVC